LIAQVGVAVLDQNPKPGCACLVWGTPSETVVDGDDGRWWGAMYEGTVVGGLHVQLREWGQRFMGHKPQTGLYMLGFGRAVGNNGRR
jgi:hypothetical protein